MNDAKEAQDVLLGVYRSTIEEGMYGHHLSIISLWEQIFHK